MGVLVDRARNGDRQAWDALVERFLPVVWEAAVAAGLGPADAADAVEITWLRLLDDTDVFADAAGVERWLVSTCQDESRRLAAAGTLSVKPAVVDLTARPTLA